MRNHRACSICLRRLRIQNFAIIGAAYEVHRVLGTGFLEVFYKDALEIEFGERQIPFDRERPCRVE